MMRMASFIRAMRSPYAGKSYPSGDSLIASPVPTPRRKRPPDRRPTVAAAWAISAG